MSRQDIPQADRKDFYLYVDEFQNFATPDFAQILSEARKYRLNLTVANQFTGQMEENIKKLKEKKEIEEKIKKKRWAIDEYLLKIKYEEQCIADLEKRLQELKNEWDQ